MNEKLKLLLIALTLMLIMTLFLFFTRKNCYKVEYQDQTGTKYTEICKGQNGND